MMGRGALPSSNQAPGSDLVLFVAGEPDLGIRPLSGVQSPWMRLILGSGLPSWARDRDTLAESNRRAAEKAAEAGLADLRVPPDQAQCILEVAKIAEAEKTPVTVVDVNRPGDGQGLVERWVSPNDVFPLLVRADGARLEGADEFAPGRVLRFIRRG
jgi:hypothetical protein